MTIRPAAAADASQIAAIIREAFPARLVGAFIYGCPGIAKFIAEQIGVQERGGETYYAVASDNGCVVGCAEARRQPDRLFLNYIAVRPAFRARGLGRRLLRAVIESRDPENAKEFALDVLDINAGAWQWYQRLGLQRRESISWWQASLGDNEPASILLAGYAQAQACHREYGFSQFSVCAAGQQYDVGRLGTEWYRLTNPAALTAPGVLAGLKRLAPERRLLLLAKTSSFDAWLPEAREIGRSHRLSAPLGTLRRRLSGEEMEYAGRR